MSIKTNGAEFKRFYSDPEWWPKGLWYDDEELIINGNDAGECDVDLSALLDTDKLVISGGYVTDEDGHDHGTFEGHFKKWRKAQTVVFLVVEVSKEKLKTVKSTIVAAGGRIV